MRMISTRFSVVRLLGIVRRHVRLLKRVFNDENLINQIQTEYEALESKQKTIEEKEHERENAYDDMLLADHLADDAVRNLFGACQEYDRNNPGSNVLIRVFPDEIFGNIIHLPLVSEVIQLDKLVVRLNELGPDHELAGFSKEMSEKSEAVKTAMATYEEKVRQVKLAEAEGEIAKEALIRKYELNYLEARKTYGRQQAEKLFPRLSTRLPDTEEEQENTETGEAA